MRQRHDLVQTAAVVGFGHLRIGQVSKRDTGLGVSPGVRSPCPTVAEGTRRGGAAEAANHRSGAAYVHAQAAVHGHAKPLVDTLARVVARHILHRAWAEKACAIERTEMEEHLIE